jgi:molybdenum cofactor cytidylyltransferase
LTPAAPGVAVAVLAAGRGSRLGGDAAKPLLPWRGRPLISWAVDAAQASGLRPTVVVTGYRAADVQAALSASPGTSRSLRTPVTANSEMLGEGAGDGLVVVENPDWAEGIASSLRAALSVLDPLAEVGAVCVGLADQPRMGAEAYRRLVVAHRDGADLVVATYHGERGNPVLLSRSLWPEAHALEGDVGARVLMRRHLVTEVPCDGTGSPADVDTLEDLERLQEES